jgi:molybdenum cofactor cytidylyltransferase
LPEGAPHVAAVVLAAGASTRLGAAKQLVEFRGVPLVRRAAEAAIAADANPVIVVLGARATEVAGALLDLAGVHLELNERWRDGLASSLVAGVSAVTRLDARCDGVLIIAADQPLVDDVALRLLVDAFRAGARIVAAAYSGTIGVPAIVGRERFESLLELGGDAGAGSWLRGRIDEVRSVPMPNAEMDIDGAEDVARLATLA